MNNYSQAGPLPRETGAYGPCDMAGHAPLPNRGTTAPLPDSPPSYSSGADALLPPASTPPQQASNPNEGASIRPHGELLLPQRGRR
jgi:hypothetical protein